MRATAVRNVCVIAVWRGGQSRARLESGTLASKLLSNSNRDHKKTSRFLA